MRSVWSLPHDNNGDGWCVCSCFSKTLSFAIDSRLPFECESRVENSCQIFCILNESWHNFMMAVGSFGKRLDL